MGGKNQESSTKTENMPPAWAKGLFERSASDAMDLYNSGSGGQTYTGSTVADLSDTTMSGVNQLAQAGGNWNTAGTRPLFQGIGAASVGPSYAENYLTQIASGQDNPHFEAALENQLNKAADLTQSRMSGAGRFGSGAHTGVLGSELGGIRSTAMANQWNQNIQNMLAATGQMDSARNAGLDRGLTAAGAMATQDQQQFQNQLTGADATLKAGGIVDQQAQRQLADEIAKWYAMDNEDWSRLGMLQTAAAGAAGNYGSQYAQSRTPVDMGSMMGGFGTLLGGMKCDIRLKEDIISLGEVNGIPVYEFNYIGHDKRFIGPMAQDLLWIKPEAVFLDEGTWSVDPRKVGFPMTEVSQCLA